MIVPFPSRPIAEYHSLAFRFLKTGAWALAAVGVIALYGAYLYAYFVARVPLITAEGYSYPAAILFFFVVPFAGACIIQATSTWGAAGREARRARFMRRYRTLLGTVGR
jgi:hypothetical protein